MMVSPDTPPQSACKGIEPDCSPRISFSAECLEDNDDFISINLLSNKVMKEDKTTPSARNPEFEFLSNDHRSGPDMVTADELFHEGKLLPFCQMHHSEMLKKLSLKTKEAGPGQEATQGVVAKEEIHRVAGNWFVDDDPSPRPPSCTILWKELLRLKKKKQGASTLSLSSSSSSSSLDRISIEDENAGNKELNAKLVKKPLERTKSTTISRIRPMVNVPICKTQGGRISSLPPLIPLRKARLDR